eukprot:GHRQ01035800.1.p5 GENE.GHRQ01035800.1~~GHRQ01035800.1.p5  ORF type:complete len:125 (+),score=58.56 GHRQ01035800.1:1162-1536(+)
MLLMLARLVRAALETKWGHRTLLLLVVVVKQQVLPLVGLRSHHSSSSSSSSQGPTSISIAPINSSAKSYMDMRDDAMEYQCKGGMFDCDGDRRDFAHKQWMDWLESGGTPKRIRDGKPAGPRSY